MKKVFDQTVRDLKREVNKKVLKVPGIEQKVLDATSNEPWGPHGSLLADIAHATRNYHEYQIIMHVIWKRLNDTGKNWRHVYKALTVLEYLVGHGSERVIDDIREHAYQISTLSDFQYIDSSGKDQGSNVRRKSQSLVTLVNDKEKIQEVRQKALINKDKYRSTFATGGRSPYSGSGSNGDRCDEDRYEGRYRDSYEGGRYRDDDRNGYGRDRDWGSKDDEIYGRGSDPYNRDGDRYGRDSDDPYGRDSYRDDENRGGRGNGYSQFGPRNRSFDRDRDQFFEEDDRYSSRGGRVEEQSQDGRRLERKLSEQSPPPSYEETVKAAHGQVQDRRSVESAVPSGTEVYSPPKAKEIFPMSTNQHPNQSAAGVSASASNKEADGFDEFDPRGSIPAVSASASGSGVDLFGDQSASVPVHSMALVPVDFAPTLEAEAPVYSGVGTNFVPLSSASTALSQPGEDPFGDGPFRATAQGDFQAQQHGFAPATSFQPSSNMVHGAAVEPPAPGAPKVENALSFDFGDALGGLTYTPNTVNGHHHFASNPPSVGNEFLAGQVNDGTFDGIQTSGPSSFVPPHALQQPVYPTNMHPANMNYLPQPGPLGTSAPRPAAQSVHAPYMQPTPMSLHTQPGLSLQPTPMSLHTQPGLSLQPTPMSLHTQPGLSLQPTTQTVHTAQGAQPPKDKFETKSTVWSDTLNRGLVNLNISGAKVNPLADIGVDFDAINRMDKRKERSSAAPVTSTITMGKAMGSGSGIGRATAGGIVPPPNPMMGSNTGMGMGRGMGMGGYGMGMNPPMGMGMNMNINMGMNQEAPMRPPAQVPGMGMGGYGTQPPYGGGYR